MALTLKLFTCLVLMVCVVASVNASISCWSVMLSMAPCTRYLQNGGDVPPPCCSGVKNLNGMAQTTPDRQEACRCLQSTARMISGINQTLASGLPKKCGVSIPYPITLSTDCNKIK